MACIHMAKLYSPKEVDLIFTDFADKVGLSCIVARCCLEECFLVWPKHVRGHANNRTMLEFDLFLSSLIIFDLSRILRQRRSTS